MVPHDLKCAVAPKQQLHLRRVLGTMLNLKVLL